MFAMMQWVNQHRVWMQRVHAGVCFGVMLYLIVLVKMQHDDQAVHQHQHTALVKRITSLKHFLSSTHRSQHDLRRFNAQHIEKKWRTAASETGVIIRSMNVAAAPFISKQSVLATVQIITDFPSFLRWMDRLKKEKHAVFLNRIHLSFDQTLRISAEFILTPELFQSNSEFLKEGQSIFDPFCLHEHSHFSKAYRHEKNWQRHIDFSDLMFKTSDSTGAKQAGLFSWKGKLFWLEEGSVFGSGEVRLDRLFRDHAEFVYKNGKRLSIFS